MIINKLKQLVDAQDELLKLYETQIADLTIMSKIELGNDVIAEIHRIKSLINNLNNYV